MTMPRWPTFVNKMEICKVYVNQLRAMLLRNITIKLREKRKLLWEVVLPVYSFIVLAFIKMAIPNPYYPAVDVPPYSSVAFDNHSSHLNYTIAVVPNTTEITKTFRSTQPENNSASVLINTTSLVTIRYIWSEICNRKESTTEIGAGIADADFMERVREKWNAYRKNDSNEIVFVTFGSKDDLNEHYWYDPMSLSVAVIFNSSNPLTDYQLEYEIRTNPSYVASPPCSQSYAQQSACRENSYALAKALEKSKILDDDCPAFRYYTSGFVTLQMLIDFTKISIDTGVDVNLTFVNMRLFPKEAYTAADWMLVFRLVIPAYLVMSLSQFVTYLLMLIVKEKERKNDETLEIAGLGGSVFWISWFVVYAVFVLIMSAIATCSMFTLSVFHNANFLLIFALIFLYGLSIINFSFMLTPFLRHYRTAGVIGNFTVNSLSLLYLIRLMMKKNDAKYLWVISLLSPAAFTLAIDKALTMDVNGDALHVKNLWTGPGFSIGGSMAFLCVDNVLYVLMAYYFNQVIPGSHGAKKHPLFFMKPLQNFWNSIFSFQSESSTENHQSVEEVDNDNIEAVPDSFNDKVGIEIVDLHKHFSSYLGKKRTHALNGINLKIYEGQITAILGHNGAGKTTLFNILTGMIKPSSGTAFIFGHDIRNTNALSAVRKMFGVCPQHNALFDNLTAMEHLKLYSAIRGIANKETNLEIDRTLRDINFYEDVDTYSKHLSTGQKRKLTIACAIIGSPKILIFDEPTAGIDPHSRRSVWSVLQRNKAGKVDFSVILLTTHFMDEADLLADRKALISKGQLRCVGTSLFLKNKFGIGYHLTFVLEHSNSVHELLETVRRHIPEMEVARHRGKELSLILPYASADKFAALFNELENDMRHAGNRFGISSFGISMTTLEEIFLFLERTDKEFDDLRNKVGSRILRHRLQSNEPSRASTNSAELHSPSENGENVEAGMRAFGSSAVELRPNRGDIIRALIKMRIRNFTREPARCFSIFVLPLLFFAIGVHFVDKSNPDVKTKTLTLNRDTYENSSILVYDSGKGDGASLFAEDDSLFKSVSEMRNVFALKPNLGALIIERCCEKLNISIVYNDTAVHSLPIVVNIVDNALFRKLANNSNTDNQRVNVITTKSHPFRAKTQSGLFDFSLASIAFGLGVQFIAVSVILSTDYVYDREVKAKSLLRVNGLPFWIYYGTFFVVLALTMALILVLHLFLIILFNVALFKQPAALAILTLLFILYTPCAILFTTSLSYLFHSAETTQAVLLNSTTFIGLLPFGLVLVLDLMQIRSTYMFILHSVFSIFDSFYLPFAIVYFVGRIYLACLSNEACSYVTVRDYFTPEILIIVVACCLQIPTFILILRLLECWKAVAGTKNHSNPSAAISEWTANNEHDNDDVKYEKFRVTNFLSSPRSDSSDYPLIIVKDLMKRYSESDVGSTFCKTNLRQNYETNNTKTAVSNLSFAVSSGEIFGLLGHTGAGKTTTIKMITAEEIADGGQIQIKGFNMVEDDYGKIFEHVGYCPQDDVLWKNITVREHIILYATIRGIPKNKIREITDSYLDGLQMRAHADKYSHQCSGGTKRKLCFALAMVGNPSIVLMDEPSNGMDPHSKRFLWDMIMRSFQGNKCAILTTHAMEEVDALCSKVGILVHGKLRCIGSTQHLKNLYGAGYTLEMKIKSDGSTMVSKELRVKDFVMRIFPLATLEETFSDHLVFRIPQLSVRSLGYCFTEIENVKHSLQIEEYSFSQTTLEQVFMKLAHAEDET